GCAGSWPRRLNVDGATELFVASRDIQRVQLMAMHTIHLAHGHNVKRSTGTIDHRRSRNANVGRYRSASTRPSSGGRVSIYDMSVTWRQVLLPQRSACLTLGVKRVNCVALRGNINRIVWSGPREGHIGNKERLSERLVVELIGGLFPEAVLVYVRRGESGFVLVL